MKGNDVNVLLCLSLEIIDSVLVGSFGRRRDQLTAGGVLKVMSGANVRMGHGVSKVSYVWVHMFLSSNYIVKKKLI